MQVLPNRLAAYTKTSKNPTVNTYKATGLTFESTLKENPSGKRASRSILKINYKEEEEEEADTNESFLSKNQNSLREESVLSVNDSAYESILSNDSFSVSTLSKDPNINRFDSEMKSVKTMIDEFKQYKNNLEKDLSSNHYLEEEFEKMDDRPIIQEGSDLLSIDDTFPCSFCYKRFAFINELESHEKEHQTAVQNKWDIYKKSILTDANESNSNDDTKKSLGLVNLKIERFSDISMEQDSTDPDDPEADCDTTASNNQDVLKCHLCDHIASSNGGKGNLLRHYGSKHYDAKLRAKYGKNNGECGLCQKVTQL